MTSHKIKVIRSPYGYGMEVGQVYNYIVKELVVEYWEACGRWPIKYYMPIYAFANAVQQGDVVNVKDLPNETEEN